jgi:pyruvate dehydrogenase (quinone)
MSPWHCKVAEDMGAKGIRVEEPGDVKDALAEALAYKDGPVVVDALVDRFALSLPSHVPVRVAKGYTLSMAKQVLAGRLDDVIRTIERNVRLV